MKFQMWKTQILQVAASRWISPSWPVRTWCPWNDILRLASMRKGFNFYPQKWFTMPQMNFHVFYPEPEWFLPSFLLSHQEMWMVQVEGHLWYHHIPSPKTNMTMENRHFEQEIHFQMASFSWSCYFSRGLPPPAYLVPNEVCQWETGARGCSLASVLELQDCPTGMLDRWYSDGGLWLYL